MGIDYKLVGNRIIDDLRKNYVLIAVIFGFWLLMTLLFHHFCPLVLFCGFPCPGCGMTRAFFSFFTLHPFRALSYNPVYPLWLVTIAAMIFRRYFQGKSLKAINPLLVITALLTIGVYIYRIRYCFPSSEPMTFVHENLLTWLFPAYDRFMTTLFG